MHPLAHLIPARNSFNGEPMTEATAASVLSAMYSESSGFVGAFCSGDDRGPTWARRIANYDRDEFHYDSPQPFTKLSETPTDVIKPGAGEGQRSIVWRHALELWAAGGKVGPMPFSLYQDYGSCVDAECAERITAMLGWRAARPQYREKWYRSAGWYRYANRGYCGDGWSGWGCANVALKVGYAFADVYPEADFSDDDRNEQIVARQWCRSGIPKSLVDRTSRDNAHAPGSITDFDGGMQGLRDVLYAGGTIATGGTVTSGGSKPFTPGRVGPHMQGIGGYDDSDEYRSFLSGQGITLAKNDFALVFNQTWGGGWSGECADRYWPTALWGPKPQGAWVCLASWALRNFDGDMLAWMPDLKGVPDPNPAPQPTPDPSPNPQPTPGRTTIVEGTLRITDCLGNGADFIVVPKPRL